jgi:hypothetical protein
MPESAFLLNSEMKEGFTVAQTAEKHSWPESLVWSLKFEGKNDLAKCSELQWGLRTWELCNCERSFIIQYLFDN